MQQSPCFTCQLPDCDDRSPHCALRRLSNAAKAKRRADGPNAPTDIERAAASEWFRSWRLERHAEASEGVRPYKRFNQREAAAS